MASVAAELGREGLLAVSGSGEGGDVVRAYMYGYVYGCVAHGGRLGFPSPSTNLFGHTHPTQNTPTPPQTYKPQAFGALDVAAQEELAFAEDVALLPCFAFYRCVGR